MGRRAQRARREYYARAYAVRRRRRQAVALGLALSTELGAPNHAAGGPGSGGIPVPPANFVILNDAVYVDLTQQGDTIQIFRDGQIRLWAVPPPLFAAGTRQPDVHLTE